MKRINLISLFSLSILILATGKVNAFDGNAAAPMLASRIVEEISKARGEVKKK
jgi:hypothetical protein